MLKKVKRLQQTTTDSRTYKLYHFGQVLGCPLCGPNSGCNGRNKRKEINWKTFRKTQYKP